MARKIKMTPKQRVALWNRIEDRKVERLLPTRPIRKEAHQGLCAAVVGWDLFKVNPNVLPFSHGGCG